MGHYHSYHVISRRNALNSSSKKTVWASLLVVTMIMMVQVFAQETIRIDRLQHLLVSASLFVVLSSALPHFKFSTLLALVTTVMIGMTKEWGDPQFENFDMLANFVGVLIGVMTIVAFPNIKGFLYKS